MATQKREVYDRRAGILLYNGNKTIILTRRPESPFTSSTETKWYDGLKLVLEC
jgi:hypothetical protein